MIKNLVERDEDAMISVIAELQAIPYPAFYKFAAASCCSLVTAYKMPMTIIDKGYQLDTWLEWP